MLMMFSTSPKEIHCQSGLLISSVSNYNSFYNFDGSNSFRWDLKKQIRAEEIT